MVYTRNKAESMESAGETPSDMLIDLQTSIELNRPGDKKDVGTDVIQERMRSLAESVSLLEERKSELTGEEITEYEKAKARAEEIITRYEKMLEDKQNEIAA